jgi:capsular exopolysaccharide synthesis family protein
MMQGSAEFGLRGAIRVVRRRLPIFLLCVILVPAAAVAWSLLQKKEYTGTASLYFRDPEFDQKLFSSSFVQNQTDPARVAANNLDLASLPRVAALTAAALHGMTEQQVSSAVSVSSTGQSDVVSIQATAASPRFAAQIANTYAAQYIAFRRAADRSVIDSAQLPLRRQIAALPKDQRYGALGQSLQQRLSQLGVLASLQTGGAELVQAAEPPRSPSSPKPVRNGLLGLFFGIVIGIAAVALAEALDRRLRDPAEVEQMFERPLLAAVPKSGALPSADPPLLTVPAAERDAFRMLGVNLRYFSLSRDIRSVVITSADSGDGKSTVAWGLAVAAASAGSKTLLIEADLRKPTLGARFDLPSRDGLSSVLAGDLGSAQAILRVPLPVAEGDPNPGRSMDVLLSGPRPPDPTDLLQSQLMVDFLRWIEERYDLVVIDTPPAAVVPDAIPLITMATGVIVVSRVGNTVREHLRRLHQQLGQLDTPVLGVVVNSVEAGEAYYGYGAYHPDGAPPVSVRQRNGASPSHDAELRNRSGVSSSGAGRGARGDG